MTEDDRQYSLEQAQVRSQQDLLVFDQFVVRELDGEMWLTIEVNGVPVTRLACMDSALKELAAGWAFMHRFCVHPHDFGSATSHGERAAVMVTGGIDIDRHLAELTGALTPRPTLPEPFPRDEPWSIPHDVLLDILREAWTLFRKDRMAEGSVHAALASVSGIEVVAFDIIPENAFAKVLGWALQDGRMPTHEIVIINGLVTRGMVEAASRVGVLIIATPFVPTADAYRAARIAGMSIVGYMRQRTVGVFHDTGLINFESVES
ncbi:MAG: formate dehydrogenase accessory sulfurtransferase FdhD [Thermomicrobiales bacterium]|nr:formate dehydrogenase accessory sulfurtransferase FdhD [Thermomicrobiales bacterium]